MARGLKHKHKKHALLKKKIRHYWVAAGKSDDRLNFLVNTPTMHSIDNWMSKGNLYHGKDKYLLALDREQD